MLTFEWDEAKRSANLGKHGIDFVDVPEMFTGSIMVVPDARKIMGKRGTSALASLIGGS